jgi:hypothetical protein
VLILSAWRGTPRVGLCSIFPSLTAKAVMAPTARAAVPAPPAPTTLSDKERIGYNSGSNNQTEGKPMPLPRDCADFYRACEELLDLSAAIEAGKESIIK